jgi:CheY-like chemotaxis protein
MAQRVFIKVIGFSDVERHALNTVFRLSEERDTSYALWTPEVDDAAQLLLVDELSYQGRLEAQSPQNAGLKLVWVGEAPPETSWRVFQRPISWPDVVQAMDQLFAPADLDFDLGFGETVPPEPAEPGKRALIASADRDQRLYLRAKLSLAQLTQADEAETAAQALELMRSNSYQVALVDFALPGSEGWAFLKQLAQARPAIPHLIVTKAQARWPDRLRARLAGAAGFFGQPPHPGKLQALLQKV